MEAPTPVPPVVHYVQLPAGAPKPLLLLVLLADTPLPGVVSKHGTYAEIFTSLFRNSIHLAENEAAAQGVAQTKGDKDRYELTTESYDVVNGHFPTEERVRQADGLLITGSAASAYAPLPWIVKLTEFAASLPKIKDSLKVFGICFGHQVLARAFGSEVVKNEKGWEVGVRSIELSERGKEIFGGEALTIQQMHQDHVTHVPEGFEGLGGTPVSSVQGFVRLSTSEPYSPSCISIITLQGHPEFIPDIVNTIIDAREANGVLSKEFAAQSREDAVERDEGIRIGRLFLKIMGV
ncbi:GMP synthase [Pseudohyphozyma bogoriensis]|nr:GMP synthase [Pseudohyphozyma bogoriensis]